VDPGANLCGRGTLIGGVGTDRHGSRFEPRKTRNTREEGPQARSDTADDTSTSGAREVQTVSSVCSVYSVVGLGFGDSHHGSRESRGRGGRLTLG